jgi:steroid delta-isomerase-like uncharacterized protein
MAVDVAGQLAQAWATAWSSNDPDKVASLFTEDCVYEDVPTNAVSRSRDELRAFATAWMNAVPDIKAEVTSSFSAGNALSVEWVISGTHRGDLPGMPATGKAFSVRGASVIELDQGKGKRCSDYWDLSALLKQLGFMS